MRLERPTLHPSLGKKANTDLTNLRCFQVQAVWVCDSHAVTLFVRQARVLGHIGLMTRKDLKSQERTYWMAWHGTFGNCRSLWIFLPQALAWNLICYVSYVICCLIVIDVVLCYNSSPKQENHTKKKTHLWPLAVTGPLSVGSRWLMNQA